MGLKLHVLCNDGSPLGVTEETIYGDNYRIGVGGSELALLTMCRLWQDRGDEVVLYNNPWGTSTTLDQRPITAFNPNEKRDVLIVFRSPNPRSIPAKGKRVWWSCDQYTMGNYGEFSNYVDKIVCISPCHADYFERVYGIHNAVVIDLPVRQEVYDLCAPRIDNRMIFTSVPDRGLQNLWRIYPKLQQMFPDLSLVITSDYRLWGAGGELNQNHRIRWAVHDRVQFRGALSRSEYLHELAQSDLMIYPGSYEELFCISVAEAQVAGVVCMTSTVGALATTNMGYLVGGDAENPHMDQLYLDHAYRVLSDRMKLEIDRKTIQEMARERFQPEHILAQWDKHIFNGDES